MRACDENPKNGGDEWRGPRCHKSISNKFESAIFSAPRRARAHTHAEKERRRIREKKNCLRVQRTHKKKKKIKRKCEKAHSTLHGRVPAVRLPYACVSWHAVYYYNTHLFRVHTTVIVGLFSLLAFNPLNHSREYMSSPGVFNPTASPRRHALHRVTRV